MKINKEYSFYWEEEPKKKRKQIRFEDLLKPIEITFNIPQIEPEIHVEMSDTGKELYIIAKLYGFKKKEISAKISKTSVEIIAKKSKEKIESVKNIYSKSSYSKTMHRSFSLPYEIDESKISSIIDDEELKIIAPKLESKKKIQKKRVLNNFSE